MACCGTQDDATSRRRRLGLRTRSVYLLCAHRLIESKKLKTCKNSACYISFHLTITRSLLHLLRKRAAIFVNKFRMITSLNLPHSAQNNLSATTPQRMSGLRQGIRSECALPRSRVSFHIAINPKCSTFIPKTQGHAPTLSPCHTRQRFGSHT